MMVEMVIPTEIVGFLFRVRLLAVHVGQLLEPGPEVVQVVELKVSV